ncbi:MAG: DNA polymerase III subunit alpha [Eubacteriaceae bacterium]|jgi:DNA polymerase-3 subunit alpha|nr:DNA polymerase III subunit alpha [Eubacteriaceae bacterium]
MFTHLHVHTQFSLLDGFSSTKGLISRIKSLGMEACAITDHGVMFGVVDFYRECLANGVKPILGCEIYLAERDMEQKDSKMDWNNYHLVLLAENNTGYQNLMKIVSAAYMDGFYRRPRADLKLLRKHSEGIICLTGCIGGRIPQRLLASDFAAAREELNALISIFGQRSVFVEIQDHDMDEERAVRSDLINLAREAGVGLVATNDSHYTEKSDAAFHEVLLCVQTATSLNDPKRMKFNNDSYYIKSEEEMASLFRDVPEALENTVRIAERCSVEIEFHNYHLPRYNLPEGASSSAYLKELCLAGMRKKYSSETPELAERLEFELSVIDSMGFNDYFLIVWDFIKYAKDNNISVGPGRGSAAGSIVAYCLDITQFDPIRYTLIFERFLNQSRVSMPDIDIDFCYENRHRVIEYVKEKYGEDSVAQIITFGTLGAKNAIRDVGRSLGMSYSDCDRVAKEIPTRLGTTIDSALQENPNLRAMMEADPKIGQLIEYSKALEGTPRHASTHAAGVVITDRPIREYVPLYVNDGNLATQFPMTLIEELGLLKMDFLGLRTLTVIKDAIDNIERSHGKRISVNAEDLDLSDQNVYKLISRGDTLGVFQLEGSGMRAFMQNLRPDTFEDIIAGISLYRPGPMQYIDDYVANKRNPAGIHYISPALEHILDVTYGCMVYQEQVMQIVRDLAGFSMGDSDNVRRLMSKKKEKAMAAERVRFVYGDEAAGVKGCVNNGISEAAANKIFDQMTDFASYAFNKSHAAAYAVISFQTAYLKTYYPTEFMAALLTSIIGDDAKVTAYVHHLKDMGIELLGPDINKSLGRFAVVDGKIRYALLAVKGLGESAVEEIVRCREEKGAFASFADFVKKMGFKSLNKRGIESLVKSGAFDSLGNTRRQLAMSASDAIDAELRQRKQNAEGQMSMLDLFERTAGMPIEEYSMPAGVAEFDDETRLTFEKEALGLYITGHPLSRFAPILGKCTDSLAIAATDESSEPLSDGTQIVCGGIITAIKQIVTKGNKPMAFLAMEDLYGTYEAVVYTRVYEEKLYLLKKDAAILIKGRISQKDDGSRSVAASSIVDISDEKEVASGRIFKHAERPKAPLPALSASVQSKAQALERAPQKSAQQDIPAPARAETVAKLPEGSYILLELAPSSVGSLAILRKYLEENSGGVRVVLHDQQSGKKFLMDRSMWVTDDAAVVGALQGVMGHSCVRVVQSKGGSPL